MGASLSRVAGVNKPLLQDFQNINGSVYTIDFSNPNIKYKMNLHLLPTNVKQGIKIFKVKVDKTEPVKTELKIKMVDFMLAIIDVSANLRNVKEVFMSDIGLAIEHLQVLRELMASDTFENINYLSLYKNIFPDNCNEVKEFVKVMKQRRIRFSIKDSEIESKCIEQLKMIEATEMNNLIQKLK